MLSTISSTLVYIDREFSMTWNSVGCLDLSMNCGKIISMYQSSFHKVDKQMQEKKSQHDPPDDKKMSIYGCIEPYQYPTCFRFSILSPVFVFCTSSVLHSISQAWSEGSYLEMVEGSASETRAGQCLQITHRKSKKLNQTSTIVRTESRTVFLSTRVCEMENDNVQEMDFEGLSSMWPEDINEAGKQEAELKRLEILEEYRFEEKSYARDKSPIPILDEVCDTLPDFPRKIKGMVVENKGLEIEAENDSAIYWKQRARHLEELLEASIEREQILIEKLQERIKNSERHPSGRIVPDFKKS
ncbi:hypothetical protein Vadar_016385 [Vaccinium darrowii]|uniref:Uncharacterized protein n=1 Tax=Vaccinium darrowii TaxID=229202 RepID=A0ACB7Y0C6_9ERIC|nr:hypothetical protein Vadar_016385 [Vaccinium darrowii]